MLSATTSVVEGVPVWIVLPKSSGEWQRATVKEVILPPADHPADWEFVVQIDSTSNEKLIHKIKTTSVDKFNQEFEAVKRRDKNLTADTAKQTDDMTSLIYLNEPDIIECLRLRYYAKKIYTSTGPILIAVNPCQTLPIYTQDYVNAFFSNDSTQKKIDIGPHVYQIGDRAYRKMFVDRFDPTMREDQTVLVSGESGAGKTESMKHILHYLAVVSATVSSEYGLDTENNDMESQIIATNPITESFGNAKTSRNNNSSRFGKFTELRYSADGYIESASIQTYLLETVRVPRQAQGERNFHIFYELFAGLSKDTRKELGFTSLNDFSYTNHSGVFTRDDGENDIDNYKHLMESFMTLDIPRLLQDEIFKIIIGILHLGNVLFNSSTIPGDETLQFSRSSASSLKYVSTLLGISEAKLLHTLTRRSLMVVGNEILKCLSLEHARQSRDNFVQELYDQLFKWLVSQINEILMMNKPKPEDAASRIGILDIFGFEFFAKNSFEQLCINYTNEKLQDHFNYSIFKSEQEVYKEEGLNWTFVDYPDNSARLELLEHKVTGIFALCDEQLKIPNCSDEKFAKSLYDKCGKHKFFAASKSEQVKYEFVIKHFACDVKYQAAGFLDKNRGDIPKEFTDCLTTCSNILICQLLSTDSYATINKRSMLRGGLGSRAGGANKRLSLNNSLRPNTRILASVRNPTTAMSVTKSHSTISKRFSKQLDELMFKIRTTRSHFIRCIKPNQTLQPGNYNELMVMQQLRSGGVLAAVQVFKSGFSNRMDFKKFVTRFSSVWYPCGKNLIVNDLLYLKNRAKITGSVEDWKAAAIKIVNIAPLAEKSLELIYDPHLTFMNSLLTRHSEVYTGMHVGKTQMFLKSSLYDHLESLTGRVEHFVALRLQYHWKLFRRGRGYPKEIVKASLLDQSERARIKATTSITAMIIIQRITKTYLCVKRRKQAIYLSIRISSWFHGYQARKKVQKMKDDAAIKIQSFFRKYLHQNFYQLLRKFAILNQRHVRKWLKRTETKRAEQKEIRCHQKATKIQSVWRGVRTRRKVGNLRKLKDTKLPRKAKNSTWTTANAKEFSRAISVRLPKFSPASIFFEQTPRSRPTSPARSRSRPTSPARTRNGRDVYPSTLNTNNNSPSPSKHKNNNTLSSQNSTLTTAQLAALKLDSLKITELELKCQQLEAEKKRYQDIEDESLKIKEAQLKQLFEETEKDELIEELQSKIKSLESQTKQLPQLQSQIKTAQIEKQEFEEYKKKSNIDTLRQEILQEVHSDKSLQESQLKFLNEKINQYKLDFEQANQKINELIDYSNQLEENNSKSEAETTTLSTKTDALTSDITNYESQILLLQKEIQQLKSYHSKEIELFQKQIDSNKVLLQTTQSELASEQTKNIILAQEKATYQSTTTKLQATETDLKQNISELEETVSIIREEKNKYRSEFKEMEAKIKVLEENKEQLVESLHSKSPANSRISLFISRMSILEEEKTRLENETIDLKEMLRQEKYKSNTLESNRLKAIETTASLQQDYSELQIRLHQVIESEKKLQIQLRNYKDTLDTLSKKESIVSARLQIAEKTNIEKRSKIEALSPYSHLTITPILATIDDSTMITSSSGIHPNILPPPPLPPGSNTTTNTTPTRITRTTTPPLPLPTTTTHNMTDPILEEYKSLVRHLKKKIEVLKNLSTQRNTHQLTELTTEDIELLLSDCYWDPEKNSFIKKTIHQHNLPNGTLPTSTTSSTVINKNMLNGREYMERLVVAQTQVAQIIHTLKSEIEKRKRIKS